MIERRPPKLNDRAKSILAACDDLSPLLDEYFAKRNEEHVSLKINHRDTSEYIGFEHLFLEIASAPSSAFIITADGQHFYPVTMPRIELHLRDKAGLHATYTQLGRIARYIDQRQLQDEFPLLTTTTYPRLSHITHKLMPGSINAVATYLPSNNRATELAEAIFESLEDFDTRNNVKKQQPQTLDSLIMATDAFVKQWREH